jgi:S1-C subfamily serine protease
MQDLLKEMAAGDKLALELLRDGKKETINLKLGER